MNRASKLLICILALVIAAAGIVPAAANGSDKAGEFTDGIISLKLQETSAASVQEWIDGGITEDAGQGSEWYVMALSQYGDYDFSGYEAALVKYLSEKEVGSASSRLKYALTLIAVGSSDSYISRALNNSIGEQGIMSLIFGMHLLNNGCTSDKYSLSALKREILSLQLADGGWAVSGMNGDVDVTAMAVQALAPHYPNDASVKSAVDAAVELLSVRQQENGGYSSYGVSNPESTAQVLVALSSLGIDAGTDSRFIKNGNTVFDGIGSYKLPDGSFCHEAGGGSSETATVQVFYSMVAYDLMKNGGGKLYVFDRKEAQPQTTEKEDKTEATVKTTAEFSQTVPAEKTSEFRKDELPSAVEAKKTDVQTEAAETEKMKTEEKQSSYKLWAVSAIAAAAVIICLMLFVFKKKNFKNYIFVAIIAAAGIVFVLFTDFLLPDSYYNSAGSKENSIGTVILSVRCDTVAGEKAAHIPENGVILDAAEFEIEDGDTVYDILLEAAGEYQIHVETNGTKDTAYVEGIGNIYEFDFGDLSGWMYFVNGVSPSVSCGEYELLDGDEIEWHYTRSIGKDLEQK